MEFWKNVRLVILPLMGVLGAVHTSHAAQPAKVRISYSSRSNSIIPFQIAVTKGLFAEEGLDVEDRKSTRLNSSHT